MYVELFKKLEVRKEKLSSFERFDPQAFNDIITRLFDTPNR